MKKIRIVCFFVLLAFSVVFPLLISDAVVTAIAIFTLIMMVAATGWNLFSGYTRYLSLGHATFYGFGAYILAVMCQVWHIQGGVLPLLLLPVIGGATGLCSLPLGWIALQTRRSTFMVITIAIFSLASLLPNLLERVVPQFSNTYLPNPPWDQSIFNIPFYYTALLLLFCAIAVSWWMRSSKFGLCLFAIGDDEDRARGLGNKTAIYKLVAWTISSTFVGAAGALNAYYIGLLDPASAFERGINIALPVTAFLGGVGTLGGPLLGAIFIVPIQQYLTVQYGNVPGLDLIVYGVSLLVVILVFPQGLAPTLQKRLLMGMTLSKKSNRVSVLTYNDLPETPAFVVRPGVSYEIKSSNEVHAQVSGPLVDVLPRSNSVPLSLRRGYTAMKAPRLVPLSQEIVAADSVRPASDNGD